MSSPNVEINSTSLGGWTSMVGGVNVAAGETVSVRLADSSGVKLWVLSAYGVDDVTTFPTLTQALTPTGTATFTAPGAASALIVQSRIGVNVIGKDLFDQTQSSFTTTFGVYVATSGGLRLGASNETTEGNAAVGWVGKLNDAIRFSGGGGGGVPVSRQVIAGAGLTGGGNLSADRTLNVVAGDSTIVVNADELHVGTVPVAQVSGAVADTRQVIAGAGLTGGGTLASDRTLNVVAGDGTIVVNADEIHVGTVPVAQVTGAALSARNLVAGAGLTGGGDLSADRTFNVVAGDSTIVVNADELHVGTVANANISDVAATKITGSISAAQHGAQTDGTLHAAVGAAAGFAPLISGASTTLVSKSGSAAVWQEMPGLGSMALGNYPTGGSIGSAATTVDIHQSFVVTQTTAAQALTFPSPTDTTAGRFLTISAASGSVNFTTPGGATLSAGIGAIYRWDGAAWALVTSATAGGAVSSVTAGAGLTGGGTGAVTLNVVAGDGTIVVNADELHVGTVPVAQVTGAVANTRQILAGNGLTGGGDLSADRTLTILTNTQTFTTTGAFNCTLPTGTYKKVWVRCWGAGAGGGGGRSGAAGVSSIGGGGGGGGAYIDQWFDFTELGGSGAVIGCSIGTGGGGGPGGKNAVGTDGTDGGVTWFGNFLTAFGGGGGGGTQQGGGTGGGVFAVGTNGSVGANLAGGGQTTASLTGVGYDGGGTTAANTNGKGAVYGGGAGGGPGALGAAGALGGASVFGGGGGGGGGGVTGVSTETAGGAGGFSGARSDGVRVGNGGAGGAAHTIGTDGATNTSTGQGGAGGGGGGGKASGTGLNGGAGGVPSGGGGGGSGCTDTTQTGGAGGIGGNGRMIVFCTG